LTFVGVSSIWISQVGVKAISFFLFRPKTFWVSTLRFASLDTLCVFSLHLLAHGVLRHPAFSTRCRHSALPAQCCNNLASARKEVIQPHLPVRLPCYDFVPVISPTLGSSSLAVRSPTSGVTNSHDVTGGVYKARERIHRSMADLRLLATPASCRRVAAYNPNYEQL
jgi:hypothetical protein